jgi:hypothetical protein
MQVGTSIRFVGPEEERQVTGIALPSDGSAAHTVEASLIGTTTWAEVSVSGAVLTLTPTVPMTTLRDGALLRFLAPSDLHGPLTIALPGLDPTPALRPDGVPASRGQIRGGSVVELVRAGTSWVLTGLPDRGCPPGTVAIGERLCMEQALQPNSLWFPAADRCNDLGGRLCSWDEFYVACSQYGAAFSNMLTAWEWLDDSSNHANSAVQVGLSSCTAERWANPNNVTMGRSRCCFTPR